jgi:Rrf2 family protein
MRVTTKGRYSLEALLYLALLPEGESATVKEIAGAAKIPGNYLEQLFIPLRHAGLIYGERGIKGGCRLAKKPGDIRVGDVLRAAEDGFRPVECAGMQDPAHEERVVLCPKRQTCRTRMAWERLCGAIDDFVDGMTIGDLSTAFREREDIEGCALRAETLGQQSA